MLPLLSYYCIIVYIRTQNIKDKEAKEVIKWRQICSVFSGKCSTMAKSAAALFSEILKGLLKRRMNFSMCAMKGSIYGPL